MNYDEFTVGLPKLPVHPGSFGACGRQILACAHELMEHSTARPDRPMYVTRGPRSNDFLVLCYGRLKDWRWRLIVRWDPAWGWVFMRAVPD